MKNSQYDSLKLIFSIVLALVFTAYLSRIHAGDIAESINKVNGSINVAEESVAANVSTVNGSIRIQPRARAGLVTTVNGGVQLHDNSEVRSAETVNGGIRIGAEVQVAESVSTVNGAIRINPGSRIGEQVSTVNGSIDIEDAAVEGDVRTVNGDIHVLAGSVVGGDVIVERQKSGFWPRFRLREHIPVLEIGADVEISGTIYLYREVKLDVHDSARIGEIVHDY